MSFIKKCGGFLLFLILIFSALFSYAQERNVEYIPVEDLSEAERFKLYNPDIHKYSFVRSFIHSLSHFHTMSKRLKRADPAKADYEKDYHMPQAFLEVLIADNFDLRIAKGYLKKYKNSPNQFIQEVTEDTLAVYQDLINVNEKEQLLWERLYRSRKNPDEVSFDYDAYDSDLRKVLHQRVQVLRRLPRVTSLVAKVILSERAEELGYDFKLGVTRDERKLLLERLDQFASDNLEWGMKEGQSSIEASIAILREMLEDPIYSSLDE